MVCYVSNKCYSNVLLSRAPGGGEISERMFFVLFQLVGFAGGRNPRSPAGTSLSR